MRLIDILKLSMHSIVHNKARTLITIIIVFVVSLLIMSISILGLSFYKSVDDAFRVVYDESGAVFTLRNYGYQDDKSSDYRNITKSEFDLVFSEMAEYPELIDNVAIDSGSSEVYYLYDTDTAPSGTALNDLVQNDLYNTYNDSRTYLGIVSAYGDLDYESEGISYLKSGRLWSKDDIGAKKIWVSEDFISQAAALGNYLEVDDYAVILCVKYIYDKSTQTTTQEYGADRYKIAGILKKDELEELNCSEDIFMEVESLYNLIGDNLDIYRISIITDAKVGYVFNAEYKKMKDIVNNVNDQLEQSEYNGKEEKRFECDLVSNLQMVKLIGSIIVGAAVFICFIILVISIGSVANTIIISVDKNKRFLGVMMAVGLKKGGVKRMVEYEALTMIIVATGLAYLALTLLDYQFAPIMANLMLMLGLAGTGVVVIPIYVPIITILAFIIMALLFARKSLAKITSMDVISVISEVS